MAPANYQIDTRVWKSVPEVKDFVVPQVQARDEKDSFLAHLKYLNFNETPKHFRDMMDLVEIEYIPAQWRWKGPITDEQIMTAMLAVDMSKNTGHPYCLKWKTNGKFYEAVGLKVILELVKARLKAYLKWDRKTESPMDPIRLFIKREPHKRNKAENKRWRLIWSISIIDRLCHDILFGDSCTAELENYEKIPSKPGLSPLYGGWDRFYRQLNDGGLFMAMDKSAWDMTVPGWLYMADCEIRERLCVNWPANSDFEKMFRNSHYALSKSKIVFSDGTCLEQRFPGITKSGSKLTISMNSRSQYMLKVLASLSQTGTWDPRADMLCSMGDDTIERVGNLDVKTYVDWLNENGFVVKDQPLIGTLNQMDFAGFGFNLIAGPGGSSVAVLVPNHKKKHWWQLCYKEKRDFKNLVPQLESLLTLYAWEPEFESLYALTRFWKENTQSSHPVFSAAIYKNRHLPGESKDVYKMVLEGGLNTDFSVPPETFMSKGNGPYHR